MATKPAPRVRLEFLDGLRGLAALYLVLFHASLFAVGLKLSVVSNYLMAGLQYGHFAVAVFIILSGYCLMLPVARSANRQLPNGIGDYLKRRARRILPPYYVAMVLSLLLVVAGQLLTHHGVIPEKGGRAGQGIHEVLTPGILLSHLFMVHNLDSVWAFRINAGMWSLATEWDIYFIFPLLLLPLWRKLGGGVTIVIACLIGILPVLFLPEQKNFAWACPWYLGLFAMGMIGAAANFGYHSPSPIWRKWIASPVGAGLLFAVFVVFKFLCPRLAHLVWPEDFLLGLAVTALIMYCTEAAIAAQKNQKATNSLLLRALESHTAVKLGAFSYSLYLIHHPIQQAMLRFYQSHIHNPEKILCLQIGIGTPLVLAISYLFFLWFERPFLSPARRTQQQPL